MDDYSFGDQWSVYYDPNKAVTDYRNFYDTEGWQINGPSDPKLRQDVLAAKTQAVTSGNVKLSNTLDFILKYGDRALTILTTTGILKNQNLLGAGYSFTDFGTGKVMTKDTLTNNAPDPKNSVFNVDFSSPLVLIITFLIVFILGYFLFFNNSKKKK